jgi:hypothetical protein
MALNGIHDGFRGARLTVSLAVLVGLGFLAAATRAQEMQQETLTVTGTLSRAMAIGAETTGWSIHFDHATTVNRKEIDAIEIDYAKPKKLEKLENKEVKATGKVSHREGIESGRRLILVVDSIKEFAHERTPQASGRILSGARRELRRRREAGGWRWR